MVSPIKTRQLMPRAQVRFRQRFKTLMTQTAERIGGLILRSANVDGVIPVERQDDVIRQALALLDQLFVGRDGRTAVRADGLPLSPYARVLLEEIGRLTAETVAVYGQWMRRTMPADILFWLDTSGRPLGEMNPTPNPSPNSERGLIAELLTLDEIRRRFPSLSAEDVQTVQDMRIFEPNPLAEYEAAHTWVDPRGYRLSDRIWRVDQETRRKLNDLMVDGISSGMSARDMARMTEQFLIPGREKIRTNKPYGTDGSFDAMRLARTEIAHAGNQAAFISAYTNPYVTGIEVVRSANGDRDCPICPRHATIGFSGERLRPPYGVSSANIPPFHPHDMCRVESVVEDVDHVTERLRRMLEVSREVNLASVMTPAQIAGFIQQLLGEMLWDITRQILPAQPRLF